MPRAKPPEPWHTNPFSVRLTQRQRIKLAKLGASKWIREQIDKAQEKHDSQNKQ